MANFSALGGGAFGSVARKANSRLTTMVPSESPAMLTGEPLPLTNAFMIWSLSARCPKATASLTFGAARLPLKMPMLAG